MKAIRGKALGRASLIGILFFLAASALADSRQSVSKLDSNRAPPADGNGDSCLPVLSADGRFVLFASTANNLMVTSNNIPIPSLVPARFNVYLRDRANQNTVLISINTNGTAGGNGDS